MKRIIEFPKLRDFEAFLREEEKSENTVSKYLRDVERFLEFCGTGKICKETVISFKQELLHGSYRPSSINSMLAAVNCYLSFRGCPEMRVRNVRVQRKVFCSEEKELSRKEYRRLCEAAGRRGQEQTLLLLETLAATGIRVSELSSITVEAVRNGRATVNSKGKVREIFLVGKLRKKLEAFIRRNGIESGPVFVNRKGRALSRTTVWRKLKSLCVEAGVSPAKVYPHNFRHLFARIFYEGDKDIARLADILGHSSVDTTRIYIATSGEEHRRRMENMNLIM